MCGRYVSTSPPDELAKYFGAAPPEALLPENYNVAPSQDVYAVVEERPRRTGDEAEPGTDRAPGADEASGPGAEDGDGPAAEGEAVRRLEAFHWGLVPMWAKDTKVGYRMINARAETIARKNAYRTAFKRRRCILPADGFYEWKVVGTDERGKPRKQPFFIHRTDGEPLAMAGVWERWLGPDKDQAEALHSVAVVTTEANEFMSQIHDRMPVFLPPSEWEQWLDPDIDDTEALQRLLVPAPEGLLTAHPVDPKVGNVRNRGPELIDVYDAGEGTLGDGTLGAGEG